MVGRPLATIISAGMSKFGRREGLYMRELFLEAFTEAINRCPNLDPKRDIDAVFIGVADGERSENQTHVGSLFNTVSGLIPKPSGSVDAACASSTVALRYAIMSIMSGIHDIVLVSGVEKMTHLSTADATLLIAAGLDFHIDQWHGLTFPGFYALMATRHMYLYGTTEEDMARVAVKNHANGALNPKAHFQKPITIEQVLSSRVIAWPLKLYDCCPISDGATVLVLARPDLAHKFTDSPVHIIGQGFAVESIFSFEKDYENCSFIANVEAARSAYKMARIEPKDVDFAEVHDCFTINEIISYEDLGFCKKGEGAKMIREGIVERGGKIPVNVSGGLKSKGHPTGATGAAQLYEVYLQLTEQAGKRQLSKAEIALTHNIGGTGASATVTICRRG